MNMETRNQWYKPNLLYNIHYRPPKIPEPPKMIVETVQFNPSVCTCGDHGCQPQFRMEKRVLWTNKEVCNAVQQTKVIDRERRIEYRERKVEEKNDRKQDRKIGSVIETEHMELKKKNDQELCFKTEGAGNICASAESFKERMSDDVNARSVYKADYAVKEKENAEVEGGDGNDDDGMEREKREKYVFKNGVGYCESKDDIWINEEASSSKSTAGKNSNDRKESDNSEGRKSEGFYREKRMGKDSEDAFNNDCMWGEKSSKKDRIDEEQTIRESNEMVDRDGSGDDEYSSENRILYINHPDEIGESYSLESTEKGLEDIEIASAFGIMSIYCNSELHSWIRFEDDGATKKIH